MLVHLVAMLNTDAQPPLQASVMLQYMKVSTINVMVILSLVVFVGLILKGKHTQFIHSQY